MKQVTRCTLFIVPMLIAIALISSCSPNKPNNTPLPYAERNVGDIKQGVDTRDSSTVLIRVIGKTQRTDGQEMYVDEYTSGTGTGSSENGSWIDTSCWFVRNGYLIASKKDTSDTTLPYISGNPYYEQYLAKTYPVEGDRWLHTPSEENDSTSYCIAKNAGSIPTYCGVIHNVFEFDWYWSSDTSSDHWNIYYAQGMDWIGTIVGGDTILCSYSNIGGKVQGHLWPAKDFDTTTLAKHLGKTRLNNIKKLLMNGMLF